MYTPRCGRSMSTRRTGGRRSMTRRLPHFGARNSWVFDGSARRTDSVPASRSTSARWSATSSPQRKPVNRTTNTIARYERGMAPIMRPSSSNRLGSGVRGVAVAEERSPRRGSQGHSPTALLPRASCGGPHRHAARCPLVAYQYAGSCAERWMRCDQGTNLIRRDRAHGLDPSAGRRCARRICWSRAAARHGSHSA